MPNIIKPKRSTVAAKVPTTTDLASGEIGVNMTDQKVYINNGTNVVQVGAGKLSALADVVLTSLATGQGIVWNGTNWVNSSAGAGGVTDVTATAPVASSGGTTPVISLNSGYGDTLNPFASKTANYVLAAPNGASGDPTFRALVAADIPTLNQDTTGTASNVTGTVAIANGGTGATTAGAALTNLGAQPLDGDLTAIAALSATSGFLTKTGTNTWALSTGLSLTTLSTITQNAAFNTTTPGTVDYGLKFIGAQGSNDRAAGITWTAVSSPYNNVAGVYVQTSSAYGSKMYLATSDSPSTGSKTAVSIDHTGLVNFVRARPTYAGSVILDAANYNTYAPTLTGTGASGSWGISVTGTAANVTGTVAVANGGTGSNTLSANAVLLGNGTAALQAVAPGASGNVLTSNGTTWASSAPAGGAAASGAIYENSQTISANYTISAGKNGLSAGPITISSGVTVTVPSGSVWTIV